ncbi:galactose-1-epimerase [Oceanobacillus sp. 143]|uniref:Aldose 1-epimerase n=1 Tax=Oceanobacillus zhaokaii TaxID=2052660 RepID=A0A345PKI7_9BACI|nr:aldose epimerase family protein [Oceanobacillus zhaokaii]AXI10517.1 galactose-1-epimerase [Oceanobacillus zhaokaii]QGS69511.1 galactose-1-epimerase [Oceanobacillus sp. 143]
MIETKEILGKWQEFTLENKNGMKVSVLDYGGIITQILVPDQDGLLENVVLGYQDYEDYTENPNFFGALIGRVAGRIQGAAFELDGKTYKLESNEGKNQLHGGSGGFHQIIWDVEPFETDGAVSLKLGHQSADGDGGYPGNVTIEVTYTLTDSNQLIIDYVAKSDKTTPITLTNHSYFNLSGNLKNAVHQHEVRMNSNYFVELDSELIPTGRLLDTEGTVFDFREGRLLQDGFMDDSLQNRLAGNGYDHYFVFDSEQENSIVVRDKDSGRRMDIVTTQPGVVMYTSNSLVEGEKLRNGMSRKYLGVCFETQGSPASLHHEGFPNVVLDAGQSYKKQTSFTFSVEE